MAVLVKTNNWGMGIEPTTSKIIGKQNVYSTCYKLEYLI